MTSYIEKYKSTNTLHKRLILSSKLVEESPDSIPVIVARGNSTSVPEISQHKFMVDQHVSYIKFTTNVRTRIDPLNSRQSIIFFVADGSIPTSNISMGEVYRRHRDRDGFLYITYAGENTFG